MKNVVKLCANHHNGCQWFYDRSTSEAVLEEHIKECSYFRLTESEEMKKVKKERKLYFKRNTSLYLKNKKLKKNLEEALKNQENYYEKKYFSEREREEREMIRHYLQEQTEKHPNSTTLKRAWKWVKKNMIEDDTLQNVMPDAEKPNRIVILFG